MCRWPYLQGEVEGPCDAVVAGPHGVDVPGEARRQVQDGVNQQHDDDVEKCHVRVNRRGLVNRLPRYTSP